MRKKTEYRRPVCPRTMAGFLFSASRQKGQTTMNAVNIIGRLTKDPEIRKTQDGTTICNLRIAIDDSHSKDDRTDFINVTVFGAQGDVCEKYLRKGFLCGVTGRLRSDVYTDQEGIKRYPVTLTADRIQMVQWPERVSEKTEPEAERAEAR